MRSSTAVPMRLVMAVVLPIVAAILLSVLLVLNQRQRAQTSVDLSVRANVATAVTQVRTEIRNEATALEDGPVPGNTTVSLAGVAHSSISSAGATAARDSGTAVFDDSAKPPAIIVATHRGGKAPTTTSARRAAVTGYRYAPFTLDSTLAALELGNGGLVVWGPSHLVAADPATAPAGARLFAVDMDLSDAPGWKVQAWAPSPGIPAATWLWVAGLLILFGATALYWAMLVRRDIASAERQRRVERDRALISGLAPVLQASLDIGEVIPAATAHLAQGLDLAGLTLSSPGDTGDRQLFAWGTAVDATTRPLATPPDRLLAGQTFAVSLTRGGRVLGVLRVVAGKTLERSDLLALSTASELLGSTLANAESYAQQQELVDRMRSVDELKTVFLATASHELRTPVTAIVGFSALLLEHWETMNPVQSKGLVERTLSNGRKLESLIEQLLDFSQLERGLPRTSVEFLDLGATVAGILAEQPELTAGHTLITQVAPGCSVRGSRSAVERIVNNLVGNAAKYAPAGTTITVTVSGEGDRAFLLVDDEGPGVAEADRERVFSRFYRGRGDSVERTSGAGIGLAIVTEYTASMSGVAAVERAPSGGARFRVSFPAVVVGSTDGAKADESNADQSSTDESSTDESNTDAAPADAAAVRGASDVAVS